MKKTNKIPTELQEQIAIFQWADLMKGKYPMLKYMNASLNGVRLTIGQATLAKKSGMVKGYPDIFLPVRNETYNGLFIELKRVKNGVVSNEQKDFISFLNSQGYLAVVCKGSQTAIDTIKSYLNNTLRSEK